MNEPAVVSPFHEGEREIQANLGVRDQIEDVGQRFIRDYLPDQHREFYEQLQYLLVGSVDDRGRPWASILVGPEGFIQTPDEHTVAVTGRRIFGDPLDSNVQAGGQVGVLGILYDARRRNRLTAKVEAFSEDSLVLKVDQTFGNCPKYIQAREAELLPEIERIGDERPTSKINRLTDRATAIIASADHFYIATHYSEDPSDATHGADVSHRGGKPGFVRVEDDRSLTFPDFSGNYHFNTLGNVAKNPRAGLLFIDFDSGDLLYLTCAAEIIWDSEEKRAFAGAERLVRFTLDEGLLVENAMPLCWNFVEYSPVLEMTGSWEEVEQTIRERQAQCVHRNFRVTRVERESSVISSFYLEPDDDERIHCHKAGQFLPIEIEPPGQDEVVRRTYTISNAPNGEYYRLSIKRELAPEPGLPPGVSSNFFHDQVGVGSMIRAIAPRGHFVLEETSARSVVLLSGGVGITPTLSMLEQLYRDAQGCGCTRKVWFIHGARNGQEHAFADAVRKIAAEWPCLTTHFVYSDASPDDVAAERFDGAGRIDMELLKKLLPFDDYDFYFCGPPPFMASMYQGLKELNVGDERIHYEFFGPGTTLLGEGSVQAERLVGELENTEPVVVKFAKSERQATWDPSKGTLLDLAESEGLRPMYSCRSGICSTCQTQVVSGEIAYTDPPLAEPESGNALICCSYPGKQDHELILDL